MLLGDQWAWCHCRAQGARGAFCPRGALGGPPHSRVWIQALHYRLVL